MQRMARADGVEIDSARGPHHQEQLILWGMPRLEGPSYEVPEGLSGP